ncbi:MAG: hypothetical protein ACRDG4_18155, partial [Chloroflexota bacterium]
ATPDQEVDVQFTGEGGKTHIVEVKDSVRTLDQKMKSNIEPFKKDEAGYDIKNTAHKRSAKHYESKQLESLVAVREVMHEKKEPAELTMMCIRSQGWVRFILGRNCDKLIRNNVTLDIEGIMLRPGHLRRFKEQLARDVSTFQQEHHSDKPSWTETLNADPALGDSRHDVLWTYERAFKWGAFRF